MIKFCVYTTVDVTSIEPSQMSSGWWVTFIHTVVSGGDMEYDGWFYTRETREIRVSAHPSNHLGDLALHYGADGRQDVVEEYLAFLGHSAADIKAPKVMHDSAVTLVTVE